MTWQPTPDDLHRMGFLAQERLVAWCRRFRAERGLPPMTDRDVELMKADDREEFENITEENRNW